MDLRLLFLARRHDPEFSDVGRRAGNGAHPVESPRFIPPPSISNQHSGLGPLFDNERPRMSDPRHHFRIPVNRRGFLLHNGATGQCTLVDLTTQGLQIFTISSFRPETGSRLSVSLKPRAGSTAHSR